MRLQDTIDRHISNEMLAKHLTTKKMKNADPKTAEQQQDYDRLRIAALMNDQPQS